MSAESRASAETGTASAETPAASAYTRTSTAEPPSATTAPRTARTDARTGSPESRGRRPTARRGLSPVGWLSYLAVLATAVVVFAVISPYFLGVNNLANLFATMATAGMLAIPATVLLITGHIDFSVGATAAVSGVLMAGQVQGLGLGGGIGVAVAAGMAVGLVNGLLVTVLGLPSLAVTVAMLATLRGLALLLPSGQVIDTPGFRTLGTARPLLNIPLPMLLFLAIWALAALALRYRRWGDGLYRIGRQAGADRLTGSGARAAVVTAFVASGASAALVGMVLTAQLGTGVPTIAVGLELTVVTAVLLGGASLSGGRGSLTATVLALLILTVLDNGLSLLNVTAYWQQFGAGALLLVAVVVDGIRTRLRRRQRERPSGDTTDSIDDATSGPTAAVRAQDGGAASHQPDVTGRQSGGPGAEPDADQPGSRAGITR